MNFKHVAIGLAFFLLLPIWLPLMFVYVVGVALEMIGSDIVEIVREQFR